MPPEFIEAVRRACLPAQTVGERLGVVRSVTEPSGLVPEADAPDVEQRGVSVAEGVPSHAGPVEIPHRVNECFVCAAVVAAYGKGQIGEDGLRAWREWHRTNPLPGLRRVDGAMAGLRAAHAGDTSVYVVFPDRDDLAPPQAGEEDELGDAAPDAGEAVDDRLHLGECQVVVASSGRRDTWTVKWVRHGLDDPAPDGVLEGGREAGVEALDRGWCFPRGEMVGGELGQVLRSDLPDEHRAEPRLDRLDPTPVAGEGVGAGIGRSRFRVVPEVECCGDGLICRRVPMCKGSFCYRADVSDGDVGVFAADLPADEPLAAALLPFGALVAASLDEGGDR